MSQWDKTITDASMRYIRRRIETALHSLNAVLKEPLSQERFEQVLVDLHEALDMTHGIAEHSLSSIKVLLNEATD